MVVWYRPPSDPVESFSKLEQILSVLDKGEKEVLFLCDTNCDFTVKKVSRWTGKSAQERAGRGELCQTSTKDMILTSYPGTDVRDHLCNVYIFSFRVYQKHEQWWLEKLRQRVTNRISCKNTKKGVFQLWAKANFPIIACKIENFMSHILRAVYL